MIVVKTIKKKNIYFAITIQCNIEVGNYKMMFSTSPFNINDFKANYIDSYELSMNFNLKNIKYRQLFFNQFVLVNSASSNRFIYKIEKEIEELRNYVLEQYVLRFGM